MSDPGHWGWCVSFRGGPCNCAPSGASTPAELASTVREALDRNTEQA